MPTARTPLLFTPKRCRPAYLKRWKRVWAQVVGMRRALVPGDAVNPLSDDPGMVALRGMPADILWKMASEMDDPDKDTAPTCLDLVMLEQARSWRTGHGPGVALPDFFDPDDMLMPLMRAGIAVDPDGQQIDLWMDLAVLVDEALRDPRLEQRGRVVWAEIWEECCGVFLARHINPARILTALWPSLSTAGRFEGREVQGLGQAISRGLADWALPNCVALQADQQAWRVWARAAIGQGDAGALEMIMPHLDDDTAIQLVPFSWQVRGDDLFHLLIKRYDAELAKSHDLVLTHALVGFSENSYRTPSDVALREILRRSGDQAHSLKNVLTVCVVEDVPDWAWRWVVEGADELTLREALRIISTQSSISIPGHPHILSFLPGTNGAFVWRAMSACSFDDVALILDHNPGWRHSEWARQWMARRSLKNALHEQMASHGIRDDRKM